MTDVDRSNDELEWIQLRQELDDLKKDDFKSYKYNWYIPTGLACTAASLCYGIYHMNHPIKAMLGAYLRIGSQFVTAVIFSFGFYKYINEKEQKIE